MEGLTGSDLLWLENYIKSQNFSSSVKDKQDNLAIPFGLNFQEFHDTEVSLPVFGYITPVLCVVVLVTNVLFVTVFSKLKMNSPTHFVLRCIAVVDTLTIALPTPTYIYAYTLKNYKEFIPFEVCYVWEYMTVFLPTITHTASLWLTTLLALQRYICVSYPLNVRLWCGVKRTYIFVIFIFILAAGCHLSRFFEYKFIKTRVPSLLDPQKEIITCFRTNSDFVDGVYVVVYSWVRAIAVNIVPCMAMIVFSTIMLVRIRVAEKQRHTIRRRSTFGSGENEPRDSRITTWLVILIVNSVCIVEMPIAAYYVMVATNLTRGENPISANSHTIEIILNLLVQISYPIHFVFYCTMSEGFRSALIAMFVNRYRNLRQIFSKDDNNNGRTSRSISVISSDTRSVIFNTLWFFNVRWMFSSFTRLYIHVYTMYLTFNVRILSITLATWQNAVCTFWQCWWSIVCTEYKFRQSWWSRAGTVFEFWQSWWSRAGTEYDFCIWYSFYQNLQEIKIDVINKFLLFSLESKYCHGVQYVTLAYFRLVGKYMYWDLDDAKHDQAVMAEWNNGMEI